MRRDLSTTTSKRPAAGWLVSLRPWTTTLSPDRETVLAFDAEGRPISWFIDGETGKRALDSTVHLRRRVDGRRRRRIAGTDEAAARFAAIGERVAAMQTSDERLALRLETILAWTPERLLAERERFAAAYRPVTILPPDQYLSIVLQATWGCSWNRCTFCSFYQDRPFGARPPGAFTAHVGAVRDLLGAAAGMRRRIFLADGNALILSNSRLRPIVDAARTAFPGRPWHGFVDVFTGERKSREDWRELRSLGLGRVYVGLETGHDPLLELLGKPGSADQARRFVADLRAAGLSVSLILMVGAGGRTFAEAHERDSLELVGSLGLGPADLVYLSPFVAHPDSEYILRCRERGIAALSDEELDRRYDRLRDGLRARLPGVRVARYEIDEFIY